jgi:hypothetical protein
VKQHFRLSRHGIPGAMLLGLVLTLMTACMPVSTVQSGVVPMIISTTSTDGQLLIQGRYFGTGAEAGSYLLAGADAQGAGGFMLPTDSWSPTRITAQVPAGLDLGFVFVSAGGQLSTGLPVNQR